MLRHQPSDFERHFKWHDLVLPPIAKPDSISNLAGMMRALSYCLCVLGGTAGLSAPLLAKDSLGVYDQWAAFRDAEVPRCYAIAAAGGNGDQAAYASIGTWPEKSVRGQLHIRLSRAVQTESSARLTIGERSFELPARGRNAWALDKAMDAGIVAAMRSASRMRITARDQNGKSFTDSFSLGGAATAMDAAIVGCAEIG